MNMKIQFAAIACDAQKKKTSSEKAKNERKNRATRKKMSQAKKCTRFACDVYSNVLVISSRRHHRSEIIPRLRHHQKQSHRTIRRFYLSAAIVFDIFNEFAVFDNIFFWLGFDAHGIIHKLIFDSSCSYDLYKKSVNINFVQILTFNLVLAKFYSCFSLCSQWFDLLHFFVSFFVVQNQNRN